MVCRDLAKALIATEPVLAIAYSAEAPHTTQTREWAVPRLCEDSPSASPSWAKQISPNLLSTCPVGPAPQSCTNSLGMAPLMCATSCS